MLLFFFTGARKKFCACRIDKHIEYSFWDAKFLTAEYFFFLCLVLLKQMGENVID